MCDAVGHPVRRLVRTRIGPVRDTDLPPGAGGPSAPRRSAALAASAGPALRDDGSGSTRSPPARAVKRTGRVTRHGTALTVRGLRGATTVDADTVAQVTERSQELILEIMARNELVEDDIVSLVFTATADVTSAFPATAIREIGFGAVPLLCAAEIAVPGSMPLCIRVLLHVHTHQVPRRDPPRLPPRRPRAPR